MKMNGVYNVSTLEEENGDECYILDANRIGKRTHIQRG